MVVRCYFKCETCGAAHTLRISVGHNTYQEHTFACGKCGEQMTVGMNVDQVNASVKVEPRINCQYGDEEGLIVNLHPEFTVPDDQLHADKVFPWLDHTRTLVSQQMKMLGGTSGFASLEEAQEFARQNKSPLDGWATIKKAWSLINNGRPEIAKLHLEKYNDLGFDSPHELNYVLYHFCAKTLGPAQHAIFTDAVELTAEISRKCPDEFQVFKQFYLTHWYTDHLHRYYDVMCDYFRDFTEFSQTLLFARYGVPLRDGEKATSSAFKRTKMFYGDAFEALTTNIAVLACLNNINRGRSFDQFEKMDLKKYLTTNKATRGNPFQDATPYFEFVRT